MAEVNLDLGLFAPAWAIKLASGIRVLLNVQAADRRLLVKLSDRLERMETKMATLDDLVSAATAEDTKIDSLIALVQALKAKVDEVVAGTLTPEQQAKIDAAFAAIGDNPDRIQAAIDANTPPAPGG